MADEPIRVLQVVTKMDRGGLETFIMNLYREIDRNRIQFDFLLHRKEPGAFDEEIKDLGGNLYYVPRSNPLNPGYFHSLCYFFKHHQYLIVHSHIDCMSALPLAAARKNGVPVRIAHSHSSRQDKDYKYVLKSICKRRIRYEATCMFACGVRAGKWMFGTDDFVVINNAIDAARYRYDPSARTKTRRELGIPNNAFVIGHVGRFSPVKNHIFVVQVFMELLNRLPGAILLLVGDGETRNDVEQSVEALGIQDSVIFAGVRADVSNMLQSMDVLLMPSLYEGLPLSLVEAQAAGLPCVISSSIPTDCDFQGSYIRRVSLEENIEVWTGEVVNALNCIRSREDGVHVVETAGFDIRQEARRLELIYMAELNGRAK